MITAEHAAFPGYSAPTTPDANHNGESLPFDSTALPFAQVDAYLSDAPEVELDIAHTATAADGRMGLRTADGYVSMFRVGQVAHITFGNSSQTARSYYMGHDGELRDYNAGAEFLPFEVRTFRRGLADRLANVPVDDRFAMADGAEIGAYVTTSTAEAAPAPTTPRFARLRRLGSFALNEARNVARRISSTLTEKVQARQDRAQVQAPTGRHRRESRNSDQVTYMSPVGQRHTKHAARHRAAA